MSVKPHTDDPLHRAKIELVCLGKTLMPDEETFERTVATTILMLVWAAIVLGPMFTDADPPRYEVGIGTTIVVFTILGRMWNFEVERALPGSVALPDGGEKGGDDEDD